VQITAISNERIVADAHATMNSSALANVSVSFDVTASLYAGTSFHHNAWP
jgi:hypothetical protein